MHYNNVSIVIMLSIIIVFLNITYVDAITFFANDNLRKNNVWWWPFIGAQVLHTFANIFLNWWYKRHIGRTITDTTTQISKITNNILAIIQHVLLGQLISSESFNVYAIAVMWVLSQQAITASQTVATTAPPYGGSWLPQTSASLNYITGAMGLYATVSAATHKNYSNIIMAFLSILSITLEYASKYVVTNETAWAWFCITRKDWNTDDGCPYRIQAIQRVKRYEYACGAPHDYEWQNNPETAISHAALWFVARIISIISSIYAIIAGSLQFRHTIDGLAAPIVLIVAIAIELFYNIYCIIKKARILQDVWNGIIEYNGYTTTEQLAEHNVLFSTLQANIDFSNLIINPRESITIVKEGSISALDKSIKDVSKTWQSKFNKIKETHKIKFVSKSAKILQDLAWRPCGSVIAKLLTIDAINKQEQKHINFTKAKSAWSMFYAAEYGKEEDEDEETFNKSFDKAKEMFADANNRKDTSLHIITIQYDPNKWIMLGPIMFKRIPESKENFELTNSFIRVTALMVANNYERELESKNFKHTNFSQTTKLLNAAISDKEEGKNVIPWQELNYIVNSLEGKLSDTTINFECVKVYILACIALYEQKCYMENETAITAIAKNRLRFENGYREICDAHKKRTTLLNDAVFKFLTMVIKVTWVECTKKQLETQNPYMLANIDTEIEKLEKEVEYNVETQIKITDLILNKTKKITDPVTLWKPRHSNVRQ